MSEALASRQRFSLAVVAITVGLGALATQDVMMKNLSQRFSVPELLFLRSVFALLIFQVILAMVGFKNPLSTGRQLWQWVRGSLLVMALGCYYVALSVLTLLDVVAIFFSAPLIATVLSSLFLKEQVGLHRWLAVTVGFAGVLLMVQPGGEGVAQIAALIAMAAALFYAASIVATRYLGETETAVTTAYYTMIACIVLTGVGVLLVDFLASHGTDSGALAISRQWLTPTLMDLMWLFLSGGAVCIGFFCLAQAYRMAEVSSLAPWEYVAVVLSGVVGFVAWGDVPGLLSLLGAGLIVVSGIYVARAG